MPTEEIIIRLFCIVDDRVGPVKKRSDAHLHDSEIITIGLLFSLKGGRYRAFYRWLNANYRALFPKLPDVTRLLRLLNSRAAYTDEFLADPSFFTVADTYGIELIHPRREGRSREQVGKKGKSNGRWIVGIKLGWLINNEGKIVTWQWDTANVSDREFRDMPLAYNGETVTLCDLGLREKDAPHENMLFCEKGTWSERYAVETDFSWVCELFNCKKMYHRKRSYIDARLGYMTALMNCLLDITDTKRSLAQFVI
jgi:Transposase DDE domain